MLGNFGDRYIILGEIGRGGMAVVYRARDTRLGRDVAIKILKADPPPPPGVVKLFRQEAVATSQLVHPHIVGLYDHGEVDGELFLVMELLGGRSLARVLEDLAAAGATMPWPRVVAIALQICAALSAAHLRGILHRDMTPSNCFCVDAPGVRDHVKILDFGIASVRAIGQTASFVHPETREPLMGTPYYMAPEVLREQRPDERVDVYGVGVILYEMVTGHRPFAATNLFVLLRAIAEGSFSQPRDLRPDLPAAAEAVILRAMALAPADRYNSAAELAEALQATLLVREPPPPLPPQPPLAPSRAWSVVLTAFTVLVLAWVVHAAPTQDPTPTPTPIATPAPIATPIVPDPIPPPKSDPPVDTAAIARARAAQLADHIAATRPARVDCLRRARRFLGAYRLGLDIVVTADGRPDLRARSDPTIAEDMRLPAAAVPCTLAVLGAASFPPMAHPVEFPTVVDLD